MGSPTGGRLLVTRDPSVLQRVRAGLTGAGAPPTAPNGAALDPTSALARAGRPALGRAVERLRAGTASAVDDVQPLYDAGLPRGLPGNLHTIAMSDEREELLARRARVAAASAEKEAALKASGAAAAQRATRRLGAYDRHAPAQAAAAPPAAAAAAAATDPFALGPEGELNRVLVAVNEAEAAYQRAAVKAPEVHERRMLIRVAAEWEPIPDACTYYTPTSSRMYSTVSWQDTLQPRLLAGPEPGERELLLLAWNGRDHFDAVLRR